MIIGQATPVPNATKLGTLTDAGACTIGTEAYNKFTGTVQQTVQ